MAQIVGFVPVVAQMRLFDAIQGWVEGWARGAEADPREAFIAVAFVVIAGAVSGTMGDFSSFVSERLQRRMGLALSADTARHLLRLSLGFHARQDTSEKSNVVSKGLEGTHQIVWVALSQMIPSVLQGIVFAACVLYVDPLPGSVIVVGIAGSIGLFMWQARRLVDDRRLARKESLAAETYKSDVLRNIRLVKAAALEGSVLQGVELRNLRVFGLDERLSRRLLAMSVRQSVIRNSVTGIVLAIAAWQLIRHEITLGTMTLVVGTVNRLVGSAEMLVRHYAFVQRLKPDAEKLFELLDTKPDILPPTNPIPLGRMAGSISFENVSFSYPDAAGTIHGVSFFVPPGQTVAIVGESGAGKTTLVTLLLRGFDVHGGRVLVDGKDLRDLDLAEYLSQVGTVIQGASMFNATVFDNIAFGVADATQEQVERAARLADAHEFILGLKDGYQTEVGESGIKLSGGQAQRLAFARALLRNPRLLILDEPTSNLDSISEARIMAEAVERLKGSRTVLIVAHRLSTVALADIVVVLDHGRVVQCGPYAQLCATEGPFRRLREAQR
ncbi:MAG: ABC transporter ATP-binding protein [Candidatus Uhrbacteria bacterium]